MGGQECAVKVIKKKLTMMRTAELASVARECEIMQDICQGDPHVNIVQYYKTHQTDDRLYIVMEYVRGPDLLELVRQRNGLGTWISTAVGHRWLMPVAAESDACYLLRQLVDGMVHLHKRNIAHRDLKPENLLLTMDNPPILKIGDFGMAKVSNSQTALKVRMYLSIGFADTDVPL
jgi:serine/threonine/tyrosine protein kinase RAD53